MYSIFLALVMMFVPIPDGTLLFVEGGSQIVMDFTDSPYSHVALIFNEDGKSYVYEAVRPYCRKVLLKDYIRENKKYPRIKLWIRTPKNLHPQNIADMKSYCEEQMGRKYRIKSYLSGKPKKTIHCGELTTRAMLAGGMRVKHNPCNVCPQDVMDFCNDWYDAKTQIGK